MQKLLIIIGLIVIVTGVLWPWLSKLPFGRLPGDIIIDKPNVKFFFPITTMILMSAIISLILWFFRK